MQITLNSERMNPLMFCYWLQGFMEIQQPESLNTQQLCMIKEHLQKVFNKLTPQGYSTPYNTLLHETDYVKYFHQASC